MKLGKKSTREAEQDAGLHVENDAGELTPEQTSEQQQQGNAALDNQKEGAQVLPNDQPAPSKTADDMKGTVTDPVSFSNPAFDPSLDAAKVELKGEDKEKDSKDLLHVFKPGHFYKKGDVVRYHGLYFKALQDMHGDIAPSMWEATGEEDETLKSGS